jgi:hypothetical protein
MHRNFQDARPDTDLDATGGIAVDWAITLNLTGYSSGRIIDSREELWQQPRPLG